MKKNLLILILLSLLYCLHFANAQTIYFNKNYDYQLEADIGIAVLPTNDGGYLLAGETVTNLWRGLRLIKTNEYGDTLWTKLYKKDSIGYASNYMIPAIGGGFAICGNYVDIATNNWDAFLVRVNDNGDTLWTKRYGGQYDESFYYLIQESNGDFVMVSNTNAQSFGNNTDMYMVKTDNSGNLLWQKTYGGSGSETALSIIKTPDSGYLLVGYTNSYGAGSYDIYIVKTDSVGNKLWQKTFGDTGSEGGGGICRTLDNNYIIQGGLSTTTMDKQAYIVKTDETGSKIWDKQFGTKKYDTFQANPIQLDDSSVVFIGFRIIDDTLPPNNPLGWLMKVSANGDSLWSRIITIREAQHYFTDIKPTNDGGFIISGYVGADATGTNTEDMWLVKVDSLGCDSLGCELVGIENKKAVGSGSRHLHVYPNPFREYAVVRVNDIFAAGSELRIVDVTGRILKNYKIFYPQQTEVIFSEKVGEGMFFVQYVKNGIVEETHKIIIQK